MKTLDDINEHSGFFTVYKNLKSERFTNLFGDLTEEETEDLNNLLSDLYGNRILCKKYRTMYEKTNADNVMQRIVKNCDWLWYTQWQAVKKSVQSGLNTDISTPLETVRTIVENRENTSETSGHETDVNAVYSFEAEKEASDKSRDTRTESNSNSGKEETTRTETTRTHNGKTSAENAEKIIDFVKYNDFLIIVMSDILSVACLSVYADCD